MGKLRISIDADDAERIKRHAESAGMDVSAYAVNAATRQMAETEAAEAAFERIDALIAEAEGRAGTGEPVDRAEGPTLTEDERRDVDEAMRYVYGAPTKARGITRARSQERPHPGP